VENMGKRIDLTGQVFGKLTVLKRVGSNKHKQVIYSVQCSCEDQTIFNVVANDLRKGSTVSCGCKRRPHGYAQTKLYKAWQNMKSRCDREIDISYKNYGARGITYTNEWTDFIPFKNWALDNGYEDGLSLERKNVNGNYEPSNCTWIPLSNQHKNKRVNVFITHKEETKILKDWAKHFNVPYTSVLGWYERGNIDEKLEELSNGIVYSKKEAAYITYKGEKKNREEWAEYFNISLDSITRWKRLGILEQKFDDLSNGINLNREEVLITYRGETKNVAGWLKHFNISKNTLMNWRNKGIVQEKFDDLVNGVGTAANKPVEICFNGEIKTAKEWAEHFNVHSRTVRNWNRQGNVLEKFAELQHQQKNAGK